MGINSVHKSQAAQEGAGGVADRDEEEAGEGPEGRELPEDHPQVIARSHDMK